MLSLWYTWIRNSLITGSVQDAPHPFLLQATQWQVWPMWKLKGNEKKFFCAQSFFLNSSSITPLVHYLSHGDILSLFPACQVYFNLRIWALLPGVLWPITDFFFFFFALFVLWLLIFDHIGLNSVLTQRFPLPLFLKDPSVIWNSFKQLDYFSYHLSFSQIIYFINYSLYTLLIQLIKYTLLID